jgi:hypothetical protein
MKAMVVREFALRKSVLALSSGGGHWVQLCALQPALRDCDMAFASVHPEYKSNVPAGCRYFVFRDATRWNKLGLVVQFFQIARIVLTVRPDVVVSTGAAPGYFALRIGKWIGARTVWVDSIANVSTMSMAGLKVRPYADLWLTQWEHLAAADGPAYVGGVF